MPEVRLTLEWPDGRTTELYSPSTVILEYLRPGESLPVDQLHGRGIEALHLASERVRARYGFACTRTDEERHRLQQWLKDYNADEIVHIRAQE